MVSVFVTVAIIQVISFAWKLYCWVWLNPKRIEKCLSGQGIEGTPYKFIYGDIKEIAYANRVARSKPLDLSHKIVERALPFYSPLVQQSGIICYTWFGTTPRLIITDPDMIKDVLLNKFGHIGKTKNPLGWLLARGVGTYDGEKWVKHRRIINPAFHLEKLKMMLPAFHASCIEMVNKWKSLVSKESCELDVWPHLKNLTAEVISRSAFGSSYEEGQKIFELQTEQAELLVQAGQSIHIPGFRFLPTKRNSRMTEIHREVRTLLMGVINKRENAVKTGGEEDLLGLLLELNSKEIKDNGTSKNVGLTMNDIIEECKLFYFAGQETTATLLVWTMVVLSIHPDWQEKAREEVVRVFGERKPEFEDLNHLKIVTMILYEVLRLYPSFIMLLRRTNKEVKLGNFTVPAGVQIAMPAVLVHHSRELWGEDADEFNPNRFSGGVSKATNNQVSFFPFGWGPRVCIGQNFGILEAKLAIAMILQQFSSELSQTYVHAPCNVITLQPQYGAQLILRKI